MMATGGGVQRAQHPMGAAAAEPVPEPEDREAELIKDAGVEISHTRSDGSSYDMPPAKDLADNPLHRINIAVDEDGNELFGGKPVIVEQYVNPAWAKTWEESALRVEIFDLSDVPQLKAYNTLLEASEPPGSPMKFIIRTQEQYDENTGGWKVFVVYRDIKYKQILQIR